MLLSTPELTIAFLGVLAAASVTGAVVFGIGMVLAPVLLLMMDPQDVIVISNGLAFFLYGLIFFQTRRQFSLSLGLPLGLAGIAGVPLGTLIISSSGSDALRLAVVAVTLALVIPLAFRVRIQVPWPGVTGPLAIWAAGVSLAGLTVGGPLIILFAVTQRWPRDVIRGTASFCFLSIFAGVGISYAVVGLLTADRLILILILLPPMYIGFRLGSYVVQRINDRVFHYVVIFVIVLASVMVVGRELL